MFETLLEYFQSSPLSLWGPFAVLILCGLGLPIPEDIVLIVAGALSVIDGGSWIAASVLMYLGVMCGDSLIFFAGRHLGGRMRASLAFQRLLSPAKQMKVEEFFGKHGSTSLFLARFLPGLRAPIFFSAGSMRVSYLKFLCFDGFAALISVPFFVWLGSWLWLKFGDDIEALNRALARTESFSLWVAGGAVLMVIGVWRWSRRVRKNP